MKEDRQKPKAVTKRLKILLGGYAEPLAKEDCRT